MITEDLMKIFVELIVFAVFIFVPVKPLTCRIHFEIQIGFLTRKKQALLHNREAAPITKSSEYNREKEM